MLHQSGSILCLAAEYIGIAFPEAHLDGFASRIRGELALQRTGIRNPAPDLLLERCIPDHPLAGTVQAGLFQHDLFRARGLCRICPFRYSRQLRNHCVRPCAQSGAAPVQNSVLGNVIRIAFPVELVAVFTAVHAVHQQDLHRLGIAGNG